MDTRIMKQNAAATLTGADHAAAFAIAEARGTLEAQTAELEALRVAAVHRVAEQHSREVGVRETALADAAQLFSAKLRYDAQTSTVTTVDGAPIEATALDFFSQRPHLLLRPIARPASAAAPMNTTGVVIPARRFDGGRPVHPQTQRREDATAAFTEKLFNKGGR